METVAAIELTAKNVLFFQLIDLSMSTSDDPKEPYFFSVLPWIILYRIIKQEEAAFGCTLRQQMSLDDDEGFYFSFSLSVCARLFPF